MFISLKFSLALVSALGISAAVAAPIMASTSNISTDIKQVKRDLSKEPANFLVSSPIVEKCPTQSTSGRETIDFGSLSPSSACWTSEGYDQSPTELNVVFSSTGNTPSKLMYSGSDGQTYCKNQEDSEDIGPQNDENNGFITLWKGSDNNCDGTEYLELKSKDTQKTIFLKKDLDKSQSSSYKVGLCTENDCGENKFLFKSGQDQQVVKEKSNSGKPVIFQKK